MQHMDLSTLAKCEFMGFVYHARGSFTQVDSD